MGIMKEKIVDILKKCNDPELPIDLWNLGLIYDLNINQNGDNFDVSILMSLTTPGCTMGSHMANDIKTKLKQIDSIEDANVDVTFEPEWTPEMMNEDARIKLGFSEKKENKANEQSWE